MASPAISGATSAEASTATSAQARSAADLATCDQGPISEEAASTQTVGEVMLRTPKTLSVNATLDEARAAFDNPKVVSALLVDGTAFAGLLDRSDLPSLLAGSVPIRTFARTTVPTVRAETPVPNALEIMGGYGTTRLVVLGDDGITLIGLLCLDRKRTGFCN